MNREIDLSVSAYGVTRPLDYDLVILPWGATEPHNLHLPYLTDAILAHDVAVDAAQRAFEDYEVRAMVLPPVAMGAQNPGQRDLKFCIHYRYDTQRAILADTVASNMLVKTPQRQEYGGFAASSGASQVAYCQWPRRQFFQEHDSRLGCGLSRLHHTFQRVVYCPACKGVVRRTGRSCR